MKIIKYLIFIAIAVALWVTAPLWMPDSTYHSESSSQVDTLVSEQEAERNALLKAQDKELAALEAKFGPKSSVIPSLKKYWTNTFTDADGFEWLRCEKIRADENGWVAVCAYRLNGKIDQDTYTVSHGNVSL